jgi:predicted transcriptional regulator
LLRAVNTLAAVTHRERQAMMEGAIDELEAYAATLNARHAQRGERAD